MKIGVILLLLIVSILLVSGINGCVQMQEEQQEEQQEQVEEQPEEISYMDVSAQEAKELIDNTPGIIIVDVSPAYANGHLPNAINYYFGDGSLDNALPTLDKEATYLVYCHVDSASRIGAQKFIDAGFKNVYRLESHYSGWVEAGYPIEE